MSASSPSDHDMSDSSSSGTYTRNSPYHSPSQLVPQLTTDLTELTCAENKIQFLRHATKPFLRIIEQPQNHFRFRYVSEMIGTHGCLLGKSYGTNKTKTHPTVELMNYQGQALIRCQLAQHNKPDEHPHKLLEDEQDRDVSQQVPEQGSYKVAFGGIGIIHTAKKDVPGLLLKKFLETNVKPLNLKDVQTRCENIAKTINLNIVRLKFSAHDIQTGEEICKPVFSEPIQNMKSAATNDLKICRISCSSGSASGGEDVFILVEKVNKKNIQVRFFELDDNGERVWNANGQFVQSDVHHQYAIVFRTPPYVDKKTPVNVKVYIELLRPSDGHTSEPKEFTYRAEPAYKQFKKRKTNSSCCSIGSSSSGSFKSNSDLPITVVNQCVELADPDSAVPNSMYPMNQIQYPTSPNDCDLGSALASSDSSQSPMWSQNSAHIPVIDQPIKDLKLNSADFDMETQNTEKVFSEGITNYLSLYLERFMDDPSTLDLQKPLDSLENRLSRANMVPDSGRPTPIKAEKESNEFETGGDQDSTPSQTTQKDVKPLDNVKSEYNAFYTTEDGIEVKQLVKELCDKIRDKRGVKRQERVIRAHLERLFNIRLSNGDTFLHMSLCAAQPSLSYIVKVIYYVKATHLLDCSNDRQQTILHLAILHDMPKTVVLLVSKGANPLLKDADELNAIHYGVKYKTCLEPLLEAIKRSGISCSLDEYNGVKQSALHMAVVEGSPYCAKLLLKYGASTSVRDQHGRTPLHLAAYDDRVNVVKTLLEYMPENEIDALDDSGNTALQIVCGSAMRKNTLEIAKLLLEKKANPMKREEHGKSAWRLARDNNDLKSLLWEYAGPVSMGEDDVKSEPEDDIKSEPEDEYESADEGDSSDVALQDMSVYAREVSALLDAEGAWGPLAKRLRLDALIDWYASQPSPTFTLLNHLKDSRNDISSKSLALILEEMGQINAASVIRKYIE